MKHIKFLVVLFLTVFANAAFAAYQWTENNPLGGNGIDVEAVYPQFETKQLVFKASDGQSYYYQWDTSAVEMPSDIKIMFSILLAALNSGNTVSVYYDLGITSNGRINFKLITALK